MVVVVGLVEAAAVADWGFDAEVVFDWGFDVFDAEACCVPGADVGAEQESTDAFGAQAARNGTRPMKTKSINN